MSDPLDINKEPFKSSVFGIWMLELSEKNKELQEKVANLEGKIKTTESLQNVFNNQLTDYTNKFISKTNENKDKIANLESKLEQNNKDTKYYTDAMFDGLKECICVLCDNDESYCKNCANCDLISFTWEKQNKTLEGKITENQETVYEDMAIKLTEIDKRIEKVEEQQKDSYMRTKNSVESFKGRIEKLESNLSNIIYIVEEVSGYALTTPQFDRIWKILEAKGLLMLVKEWSYEPPREKSVEQATTIHGTSIRNKTLQLGSGTPQEATDSKTETRKCKCGHNENDHQEERGCIYRECPCKAFIPEETDSNAKELDPFNPINHQSDCKCEVCDPSKVLEPNGMECDLYNTGKAFPISNKNANPSASDFPTPNYISMEEHNALMEEQKKSVAEKLKLIEDIWYKSKGDDEFVPYSVMEAIFKWEKELEGGERK